MIAKVCISRAGSQAMGVINPSKHLVTKICTSNLSSFSSNPYSCACCGMSFCMRATNPPQTWVGGREIKRGVATEPPSFSAIPPRALSNGLNGPPSIQSSFSSTQTRSKRGKSTKSSDEEKVDPLETILAGNRQWVERRKQEDPDFFNKLGETQKPKYLYFGCSDSRVPANEILGLGPGTVFIHRNIGNLVPGNDLNALSVLEYAVAHLNVTDIIVTGHYDCGAIRAATRRQDLGMLENWLRLIRDVYRIHRDHLDHILNEEEKHRRLVELNVVEQCLNLYKTGVVQRKRMLNGSKGEQVPRIHGLVFDPKEGILRKLKVDFDRRIGNLDHIYGLYDDELYHQQWRAPASSS